MKIKFGHIISLLFVLLLFSACGKGEDKLIPRSKLSKIYAEMLLTDQWIQDTPGMRSVADTSLIYEPILEKYGYTKLDYIHSVTVYLDDPERFARVWRECSEILDERLVELKAIRKQMEEASERLKQREKYAVDFKLDSIFPCMYLEPYIHYYDSLVVELDTLTSHYRFLNIERSDTTYDGLVMNVRLDTLALRDTLPQMDSLLRMDSLARMQILDAAIDVKPRTEKNNNRPERNVKRPSYNGEVKTMEGLKILDAK